MMYKIRVNAQKGLKLLRISECFLLRDQNNKIKYKT